MPREKRERIKTEERETEKERGKTFVGIKRAEKSSCICRQVFFHCSVCEITKKKQKMGGTKKLFSFFSLRFTEIAISQALISVVLALSRHFAKALAASEAD